MLLARASGRAAQFPFMRGDTMLNIPETVKALYKRDGVNKNFRAHFPNGELPDITNENIVQESVKFQESVCSQDVFKFGLTEASVIEFETVGVANMYGMTITCYSEIDCSSLSAAEIEDIEAGTWDGTFDSVNKVFAVPYGTFLIESGQRDHQAMTHRRVTAYSGKVAATNPFESAKDALLLPGPHVYDPSIDGLVMGQVARKSPAALVASGYTAQTLTLERTPTQRGTGGMTLVGAIWGKTVALKDASGNTVNITFEATGRSDMVNGDGLIPATTHIDKFSLFKVDYNGGNFDNSTIYQSITDILEGLGVNAERSGFDSFKTLIKNCFPPFSPFVGYGITPVYSHYTLFDGCVAAPDGEVIYPYRPMTTSRGGATTAGAFYVVSGAVIYDANANVYPVDGISQIVPTVTMYTPNAQSDPVGFKFEASLTERKKFSMLTTEKTMYAFGFTDAFAVTDLVNGWLELTGRFATASRAGGMMMILLSDDEPVAITPTDYSEMWWDEYNVDPIGTVRYAYTDATGEEQVVNWEFGQGESVYDMTDNAVLRSMTGASPEVIQDILANWFIPNSKSVNFCPVDLDMKGLPFLEAGDAISVTAQDGTVCKSFILRRELDGVQALADQISSESGLIIESEG